MIVSKHSDHSVDFGKGSGGRQLLGFFHRHRHVLFALQGLHGTSCDHLADLFFHVGVYFLGSDHTDKLIVVSEDRVHFEPQLNYMASTVLFFSRRSLRLALATAAFSSSLFFSSCCSSTLAESSFVFYSQLELSSLERHSSPLTAATVASRVARSCRCSSSIQSSSLAVALASENAAIFLLQSS